MFPPFVTTILKILQFVLIILVVFSAIYVKRHEKEVFSRPQTHPKSFDMCLTLGVILVPWVPVLWYIIFPLKANISIYIQRNSRCMANNCTMCFLGSNSAFGNIL